MINIDAKYRCKEFLFREKKNIYKFVEFVESFIQLLGRGIRGKRYYMNSI